MANTKALTTTLNLVTVNGPLPHLITAAGRSAAKRFVEFFTARIRNGNTREAYARAAVRFCSWCEERDLTLEQVDPIVVAAYVEELGQSESKPTVKQHLAALRMLFDHLVTGHIMPVNPATSVRGPKYVIKKGRTPVLSPAEARQLLDSIDTGSIAGLRDRALIGVMVYSFARVGATVGMNVKDYFPQGRRMWFRLHEKGGKHHEVPAHHNAEQYVDAYLAAQDVAGQKDTPLFQALDRSKQLTGRRLHRTKVLKMIKRRARRAELPESVCCHTFRATGITAYLENGGTIENAQRIAAHESPRTTKLYDRTGDELTLDEIERIVI